MRVYLNVPFAEKAAAKARGAHWDISARRWYVVDRPSYRACRKWQLSIQSPEVEKWLNDTTTDLAYSQAMAQYNQEKQAGKYDRLPRRKA